MPFAATWMDIEIIILLKPNRYKYYILLMCGIKKKVQMNLLKDRFTDLLKQTYGYQVGNVGGER